MMKTSRAMFKIKLRIRYCHRAAGRGVLAGVLLPVVLLATLTLNRAQATAPSAPSSASATFGVRQFYLTKVYYSAVQAPTACAEGYHFASIWEIADPSSLEYNTTLGFTSSDSGAGPPTAFGRSLSPTPARGWVRTGYEANWSSTAGQANCNAWSSNNGAFWGTVANLPSDWTGGEQDVGVWNTTVWLCDMEQRVWCVQDDSVWRVFLPLVLRNN